MIRPVTAADLGAFHGVMLGAGMDPRSSWSRTTLKDLERSLLAPDAGGFVAESQGEVVGCVGYRPGGRRTLTLNKLATRPQVRGRGLGRRLVQAVEVQAQEGGYVRVLLAVSQFNLDVLPFYTRLGYAHTQELYVHAHPASPPPLVLVKDLKEGAPA